MAEKYKEYYAGKTILVTGGAGAIGGTLTRTLSDLGAKLIIVLDDLSSAELWNVPSRPNVLFVKGSVLDEIELKRVFFEGPQVVFHLAALFANQNSIDHPETDLMVNGLGTLRMLQYSSMKGIERFVYASSGCSIYGSSAPLPLTEEHMSLHLSSPYQITKMLGELYCNFFKHHHDLPIVETRFFNSYGPGEIPGQYRNVIPNFIYWAMCHKPLVITGTGEETRDFCWVHDIADGLLRAGFFPQAIGQAMNLASEHETSVKTLAELVTKHTNSKAGITFGQRRKWDTKSRLLASVDRARELLDYEPSMKFEDGLKITIDWFRSNWDNIRATAKFGPGVSSATREVSS